MSHIAVRRLAVVGLLMASCASADDPSAQAPDARVEVWLPDVPLSDLDAADAAEPRPQADGGAGERDGGSADMGGADAGESVVSDGGSLPFVCDVRAPTACAEPAPTYADVAPIFAERCVICHAGDWNGPWPLTTYRHVADWRDDIRADLLDCSMPPRDAGVAMPVEERERILGWIRCGLPE